MVAPICIIKHILVHPINFVYIRSGVIGFVGFAMYFIHIADDHLYSLS